MNKNQPLYKGKVSQLLDSNEDFDVKLEINYKLRSTESSDNLEMARESFKMPIPVLVNYRKQDEGRRPYVMVPLAPHIINFYTQAYKSQKTGLFHARLNNFLAGSLRMMTEKQPYTRYSSKRRLPGRKLKVVLPATYRDCFIREDMVYALSDHLTYFFKEYFLAFVDGAVNCGISDNAAVETFLSKYEVSPDYLCADTARKMWRDRKVRVK